MSHLIRNISLLAILLAATHAWAENDTAPAAPAEKAEATEEAAPAEAAPAKTAEDTDSDDKKEEDKQEGEGEADPAEGDAAPVEGDAAPVEGDAAPAEGDAAPAEGDAAPAEGDAAPAVDCKAAAEACKTAAGEDVEAAKQCDSAAVECEAAAAKAAQAAKEEAAKEAGPPEPILEFHKGELTRLGSVQLQNQWQAFGVGLGYTNIDDIIYAEVAPNLSLNIGKFSLGLGAPIRIEMLDTRGFDVWDFDSYGAMANNAGEVRLEDWDQTEDYLRPLRNLSWGKKEDHFYLDLNRVKSKSIGHGQLMRRYSPNVDIDEDNLFAAFDAYGDIGGFEFVGGPWPSPNVLGGLFFLKPMGMFSDNLMAKTFSIGASYVTDVNAPVTLDRADNGYLYSDGSGQLMFTPGYTASGFGVDGEMKVLKTDKVDIKVYGDYSQLILPLSDGSGTFGDGGLTLGALFRMNFGAKPVRSLDDEEDEVRLGKQAREMKAVHAMRFRLEGRSFGAQYLPSYFNTIYQVQKYQFASQGINSASQPTKIGYLESQAGTPGRLGHYLELSYSLIDALGITFTYEDAFKIEGFEADTGGRNMAVHVESGGLKWFQLFGTYYLRNFQDFGQAFSFSRDNEILYVGGRIALLPILFFNVAAQRAFRVSNTAADGVTDLATESVDGENYYLNPTGFANTWQSSMGIELGFQF
jgi:hypothetical protein